MVSNPAGHAPSHASPLLRGRRRSIDWLGKRLVRSPPEDTDKKWRSCAWRDGVCRQPYHAGYYRKFAGKSADIRCRISKNSTSSWITLTPTMTP